MRVAVGLALVLLALVTGCAPAGPPPPGPLTPARGAGCTVQHPANWPARAFSADQAEVLVIEATARERLVITRMASEANTPLDTFADRVEARVRTEFPTAVAEPATTVVLSGRPARRVAFTLEGGAGRGERYAVEGGWIVETEARPEYAEIVSQPFAAMLGSLAFEVR